MQNFCIKIFSTFFKSKACSDLNGALLGFLMISTVYLIQNFFDEFVNQMATTDYFLNLRSFFDN